MRAPTNQPHHHLGRPRSEDRYYHQRQNAIRRSGGKVLNLCQNDEIKRNELGIRLFKVCCAWPLSHVANSKSSPAPRSDVIVEEKRSLPLKCKSARSFTVRRTSRFASVKKTSSATAAPVKGALDLNEVAICIVERLVKYHRNDEIIARLARMKEFLQAHRADHDIAPAQIPTSALAVRTTPRPSFPRECAPTSYWLPLRGGDGLLNAGLHAYGRGRQLDW